MFSIDDMILAIMHPRRIKSVIESINRIDYIDIVLAKNMLIVDAINSLKSFALDHGYKYMILTSDDLIIPYEACLRLYEDILLHGFKVITGYSRIKPSSLDLNITEKEIYDLDRKLNRPVFYHEYRFLRVHDVLSYLQKGIYIIPVFFLGWSLTAIEQSVLKKWKPRGWFIDKILINNKYYTWHVSVDLHFSYSIRKMGIQAYCDLTVYAPHLAVRLETVRIGLEKPQVEFRKKRKSIF